MKKPLRRDKNKKRVCVTMCHGWFLMEQPNWGQINSKLFWSIHRVPATLVVFVVVTCFDIFSTRCRWAHMRVYMAKLHPPNSLIILIDFCSRCQHGAHKYVWNMRCRCQQSNHEEFKFFDLKYAWNLNERIMCRWCSFIFAIKLKILSIFEFIGINELLLTTTLFSPN